LSTLFKYCVIISATDGSEGDEIKCLKPDQPAKEAKVILHKQTRELLKAETDDDFLTDSENESEESRSLNSSDKVSFLSSDKVI